LTQAEILRKEVERLRKEEAQAAAAEFNVQKRKFEQCEEELISTCAANDVLRKRDEGLFYPHMPYMEEDMPGHTGKTVGQFLNENSEVNKLEGCIY